MKTVSLLALAATLSLAACGTSKTASSTNGFPGFTANPIILVQDDALSFARDLRPVDGDLVEVKLAKDADGKYTASLRTAFYDRINGKAIDETNELASGLTCLLTRGDYSCSVDKRPVDGALTVLSIAQGEEGMTAKLTSTFVNRQTGENEVSVKELGEGLKAQQ